MASDTDSAHSTPSLHGAQSTTHTLAKTAVDAHFSLDSASRDTSPPPFSYGAPPPLYLVTEGCTEAPTATAATPTAPAAAFEDSSVASSSIAVETKAALPPDTKAPSKDLDDGEPPPPYTEGSSPIEGLLYVMAAAGSIITQVSQGGPAPINTAALGGGDENITLDLR